MDTASVTDIRRLQGVWTQTRLVADGVPEPPDDEHTAPGAVCIFEGDAFRVVKPDGAVLLKGVFTLDASISPKAIDWIDSIGEDAGKILPAIYELTDNTFRFIVADEGQPRPRRFKSVSGLTMREFIRVE